MPSSLPAGSGSPQRSGSPRKILPSRVRQSPETGRPDRQSPSPVSRRDQVAGGPGAAAAAAAAAPAGARNPPGRPPAGAGRGGDGATSRPGAADSESAEPSNHLGGFFLGRSILQCSEPSQQHDGAHGRTNPKEPRSPAHCHNVLPRRTERSQNESAGMFCRSGAEVPGHLPS